MNGPNRNVEDYSQDEVFIDRFDALLQEIRREEFINRGSVRFEALQDRMRETNVLSS